ncbi:WXG100 family type VII secretion target [Nocardia farcinica]|uniref:WXG100 family type VII secretion target n=1 Tax=Nocardia farcinica TaxID=37329 RepID=UPI0022BA0EE2|nr:WXG100 family type VII secretion target [Nocardia farcinica]MCZ9328917.1 WXG100 family type VII secretion target [Nocardia farcinica]
MTTSTTYPVETLSEPQISDPIHDYVELVISGNGTSLTYHLNNLIAMATAPFLGGSGFNCISTITNNLSGDWGALQKSADAIGTLAEYNRAYRAAVDAAMSNVADSWQGNAAESARAYFASLSAALDGQATALAEVAEEIQAYALASYGMANGIADLVQFLGDEALAWIATEVAAATAASTGVGAGGAAALHAVATAIAAVMATRVVDIIGKLGHMVNASEALVGVMSAGISAASEASAIPALPASTYDHPGVF